MEGHQRRRQSVIQHAGKAYNTSHNPRPNQVTGTFELPK